MEKLIDLATLFGMIFMAVVVLVTMAGLVEFVYRSIEKRSHNYKLMEIKKRLSNFNGWNHHEHKELLDDYVIDFYYSNKDLF